MASGLRTKAEALALAGCDFLVVVSGCPAGLHVAGGLHVCQLNPGVHDGCS
jgi:hypothetical protein